MNAHVKVGSKVTIPLFAGLTVTSQDPTIVSVTQVVNTATAEAKKIGDTWINFAYGGDLNCQWA